MKNILWVSGITADYRIKFFDSVRTELRFHGFDLIVVAGKGEIHGRSSDNQVPGVTYLPLTKVRRFGKEFVTLDGLSKTISEHLPVAVVVGAHLNDRTAIDIRGSGYRGKLIGLVCGYEPSGIVMSNVKAAAWRTFRRRLFDQFLAYGFFSRAWLKRNGVSEDLVTYFKNSTISAEDLEHSGAAVPSNPNRKSLHVVYAGTMTKDKKCEEILRAAMTLPEHRFYLYGGGPELDRLMAIRDGEQITNVSFHDRLGRHELLSKLREFDVAVMPEQVGFLRWMRSPAASRSSRHTAMGVLPIW
jgi:hypothetical protein